MFKKLACISIALCMLLLIIPTYTSAALLSTDRIAGQDRYSTASQIAEQGWNKADYAIICSGENFPDALSACPLAQKYDAPILLTTKSNLPSSTRQTLIDLGVKSVFIVGGEGVISPVVEDQLSRMEIEVTRISGQDRYETAIRIAEHINNPTSLFVVSGEDYADAASIAPIAGFNQIPIILVPNKYLPSSIKQYIVSVNINNTYVIGNTDIISETVSSQFVNCERILGSNKYDRNIAVNNRFSSEFNANSFCLANGEGFADLIAGAAYAGKFSEPIFLTNNRSITSIKNYYQNVPSISNINIFGGTGVISNNYIERLCMSKDNEDNQIVISGIGDSLSYGQYATKKEYGFLSKLNELVIASGKDSILYNNGDSGATVKSTLAANITDEVNEQKPDIIIIELGTNDRKIYSVPEFTEQLETLTNQIDQSNNPLMVFVTTWGGNGKTDLDYDQAIKKVANEVENSILVNIHSLFVPANYAPAEIATFSGMSDGWHPNNAGHQAIAKAIWGAIEEIVSD